MKFALVLLTLASLYGKPVRIELPGGSAEFEWVNSVAFRLKRSWHENPNPPERAVREFESGTLRVEFAAGTLAARVTNSSGKLIATLGDPVRAAGKIVVERQRDPAERIYGQTGPNPRDPFFFSSAGFGQAFRGAQKYVVDVQDQRIRVTTQGSDSIEYFFLYGPTPKEIYDQRKAALQIPETLPMRAIDPRTLDCTSIHALNQDSLSANLYVVTSGSEWEPFLGAYTRELFDRGLPVFRPLVLQFTRDPNAWKFTDVTMFGDEILVAPKCSSPLTLPQGLWTDLKTGVEHKSRSTVPLTDDVTLFARNGSILPIRRGNLIELHYFPKLGAEFFIFEPDVNDYSQVHASQALDQWRLEIESKVTRTYEWVLHHIGENPKRIRVEVKAGQDHILNLPQ